MPGTGPLTLLRQVREAAGLKQPDMAIYFGFTGPNGRNTVARWENGEGNPPAMKHRRTFMAYLGVKLGLHNDRQRFEEVWHTLEERWGWPAVTDHEWLEIVTKPEAIREISTSLNPPPRISPPEQDVPVAQPAQGRSSLSDDLLLATAIQFLRDGSDDEATNVLSTCSLKVTDLGAQDYRDSTNWYIGLRHIFHIVLLAPRTSYDILHDDNHPVKIAIRRAIEAVLPSDPYEPYIEHFNIRAKPIMVDTETPQPPLGGEHPKGTAMDSPVERKEQLHLQAFSEVTDQQRQLLIQIIRELTTGQYRSEIWGCIAHGREWDLHLDHKAGGEGVVFEDIEKSDLEALEEAGYMRLRFELARYSGSLKPKAHQQYQVFQSEHQSSNNQMVMSFPPSAKRTDTLASCYISYSPENEDFASLLHKRLIEVGLRVWFAPADMQGGKKMHEQISQAIREQDKLLLVLSEHSLQSPWVETEIRKARRMEQQTGQQKLFPIRLIDMARLRAWECFDADTGEDLAVEVREYFIPDFTQWKDHDAFERAFARLVKDLQAGDTAPNPYMYSSLLRRSGGYVIGMDYHLGLKRLRESLDTHPPSVQTEFATLEARLFEVLRDERLFGSSENTRATKAQVIHALNQFVNSNGLGSSFTHLCR